jgi:hypothetical protein
MSASVTYQFGSLLDSNALTERQRELVSGSVDSSPSCDCDPCDCDASDCTCNCNG